LRHGIKPEFGDDLLELLAETILVEEDEPWGIFATTDTSVSRQNNRPGSSSNFSGN
jgi:hypothetical protein